MLRVARSLDLIFSEIEFCPTARCKRLDPKFGISTFKYWNPFVKRIRVKKSTARWRTTFFVALFVVYPRRAPTKPTHDHFLFCFVVEKQRGMLPYVCTTHKPRFRWRNGSLKCHFAFWRTPTAERQKPWKHYRGAASAIFSVAYALGHHTTAILKSEGARGGQKATKTCQNLLSSGTGNCVLWKKFSVRGTKNSAVLYSYIEYRQTKMNSE